MREREREREQERALFTSGVERSGQVSAEGGLELIIAKLAIMVSKFNSPCSDKGYKYISSGLASIWVQMFKLFKCCCVPTSLAVGCGFVGRRVMISFE